jgi:hypothetical protein
VHGCCKSCSYKEMLRVMKFVVDTKQYCLKMRPVEGGKDWDLVSYCNSDRAGDTETRISVTGFIIYLLGVPICWRSKGQKGVTLSSSEAEYGNLTYLLFVGKHWNDCEATNCCKVQ